MKTRLMGLVWLFVVCGCLGWGQSSVRRNYALPEDTLDRNYTITFRMTQGTNVVEVRATTARRSFQVSTQQPALKLSGRIFPQPEDKVYLEFDCGAVNPTAAPEKRAGKSQANNQMFASLAAFIVNSRLSYNPQQNESNRTETASSPAISAHTALWLRLGRPATLLRTERETFQVSVSESPEAE